jgi:hypothetical protein
MWWLLWLLLGGLVLSGVVIIARYLEARGWQSSLMAYRLRMPSTLTVDDLTAWLASVGAATHPPRWSLLPEPPLCLEVIGTAKGIEFRLLLSRHNHEVLLSGLRGVLPGIRIEALDGSVPSLPITVAAEATLTTNERGIESRRREVSNTALLASLQPLHGEQQLCIQWIFTSGGTPRPVHAAESGKNNGWAAYLLEGEVPTDAEAVRALRLKRQDPLLVALVRVGASANSEPEAWRLFHRVWPNLHAANAIGVRLVRRWVPSRLVAFRQRQRAIPLIRWPLLLNASELAGLLALPVDGVRLPGLALHSARQLPPAPSMPSRGAVVGVSNWPGMTTRFLALKTEDRLRHVWATAPTGAGKSTLLAHLALHDIAAGSGVIVSLFQQALRGC